MNKKGPTLETPPMSCHRLNEALREGTGVLDVAGGQGDLSWALSRGPVQ